MSHTTIFIQVKKFYSLCFFFSTQKVFTLIDNRKVSGEMLPKTFNFRCTQTFRQITSKKQATFNNSCLPHQRWGNNCGKKKKGCSFACWTYLKVSQTSVILCVTKKQRVNNFCLLKKRQSEWKLLLCEWNFLGWMNIVVCDKKKTTCMNITSWIVYLKNSEQWMNTECWIVNECWITFKSI